MMRAMRARPGRTWLALPLAVAACAAACGSKPAALSRDALLDPTTCAGCHPDQFAAWRGSMHAYASDDPVFLAMNRRGQRETNGALGTFCVKCHAPMAVRDGKTKDGTDLASLPRKYAGVTCFFCHSIDAIEGTHDAAVRLATDGVIRGEYTDPKPNDAHASAYSVFQDRDHAESSALCGACHDIVAPPGAAIERTFAEWSGSVYAGARGATCSQCHMDQSPAPAPIATGVTLARRTHDHAQPGVDLALGDFPDADAQRAKVRALLATTLQTALCVRPAGAQSAIRVIADDVGAGHGFPSGAGQDRRVWFEVVATAGGATLYQSGVVPDGTAPTALADPDLWLLRDCMFDRAGKETHRFWEAATFETNQLPWPVTFDALDPRFYRTHVVRAFPRAGGFDGAPDKVTLRVRVQPIGLDVLDELVQSGDLDPAIAKKMGVLDVGEPLEWTPATATETYVEDGVPVRCVTKSNLSVGADKFPAPERARCGP